MYTLCLRALVFVLEVGVLEDHLDDGPMPMRLFYHSANVGGDVVPVAGERLADIDDHVDLGRAGLVGEDRGRVDLAEHFDCGPTL